MSPFPFVEIREIRVGKSRLDCPEPRAMLKKNLTALFLDMDTVVGVTFAQGPADLNKAVTKSREDWKP